MSELKELTLPKVETGTLPAIKEIVTALNVPREVLASEQSIVYAWRELPRELSGIPEDLRDELYRKI